MRPQWNYVFWYLIGIILFYLIPTKITKEQVSYVKNIVYVIMLIIFVSFGTMLTVEKNYRSRLSAENVSQDFNNIWMNKFHKPLKYVGGFLEFSFPLTIYGENHPINIMDTYGYKNIWIDEKSLKNNGAIIISRNLEDIPLYVKKSCPYVSKNYEIQKYKLHIKNVLNMPREYIIYYVIVPPMK